MTLLEVLMQECRNLHRALGFLDEDMQIDDFITEFDYLSKLTSYETLIEDEDAGRVRLKLFAQVAYAYGRQKWKEGVEAARNNIVKECSYPPEFVD